MTLHPLIHTLRTALSPSYRQVNWVFIKHLWSHSSQATLEPNGSDSLAMLSTTAWNQRLQEVSCAPSARNSDQYAWQSSINDRGRGRGDVQGKEGEGENQKAEVKELGKYTHKCTHLDRSASYLSNYQIKKCTWVATSSFNLIYYLFNLLLVLSLGALTILNWWVIFFNQTKQ